MSQNSKFSLKQFFNSNNYQEALKLSQIHFDDNDSNNGDFNPHQQFISKQEAPAKQKFRKPKRDDNNLNKMPNLTLFKIIKIQMLKNSALKQKIQMFLRDSSFKQTKKVTFLMILTFLEKENKLLANKDLYYQITNKKILKAQKKKQQASTQEQKEHQQNVIKTLERASKSFELFIDQQPQEALKSIYRVEEGLRRIRNYNEAKQDLIKVRQGLGLHW